MLTIRNAQLDALSSPIQERFGETALRRLLQLHPEECALLGDPELRNMVTRSQIKADVYGLITRGQIYQFVESTLLLGDDFDESPEYPWAQELLADKYRNPKVKAAKLQECTNRAIDDYMATVDDELLNEDIDDGDSEPHLDAGAHLS